MGKADSQTPVTTRHAFEALRLLCPDVSVLKKDVKSAFGQSADLVLCIDSAKAKPALVVHCRLQVHPSSVPGIRDRLAAGLRQGRGKQRRPVYFAVFAPYITPLTFNTCRSVGLNAWDRCGNAVELEGLYIWVQGNPNSFVTPKEVKSVFSPKASRIPRLLLTDVRRDWHVTALAGEARMDKGHVSRVLSRLVQMHVVRRTDAGAYKVADDDLLLDAWTAEYRPSGRRPERYYLPLENPYQVMNDLAPILSKGEAKGAFTGPSAANLIDSYLRVQRVDLFWDGDVAVIEERAQLQHVARGANFFIYEPYDGFVYYDRRLIEEVPVVSDVQLCLDLATIGGRARQQAEDARRRILRARHRQMPLI